jgi:type II secretory pathway component PulF
MNPDELITLNEEIAAMARAGLPLEVGLRSLAQELSSGRLQQVTSQLASDLKSGRTLPEALERQSGRVPAFYAGLITAGIRTNRLADVMVTLTTYARSVAELRATVVSALFYPSIVLVYAFGLFGLVCYFILPQFEEIFTAFQMRLPFVTTLALKFGRNFVAFFIVPLFVLVVVLILLRLLLRYTDTGRLGWTHFLYSIPLVGTLVRATRLAAFTDLLAILVDHKLPLPEAFRLAGTASSDPIMAAAADQVQSDLSQGMPLGTVLRSRRLVPELIAWMTGLGEQRGTLGQALHQVAAVYRRQAEVRASLLRNLLPPFLIIMTAGVLVGFFIFATIFPMYRLLEGLTR